MFLPKGFFMKGENLNMNKFLTKIIGASLAIAMMIGVGVGLNASKAAKEMNAATNATQYSLINSVDDLEAGKSYLITNGTSGNVKTMATTSNTNNRPTTQLTVSNGKLTRGSSAMSVTLGGSSGAWTFHTDNYAGTAGYFGQGNQTSNNYLKIYASVGTDSNGDTWTISFNNDAAVITSTKKTSRNVIMCNSSGTPISCYTSGQDPVYLWKEVAAVSVPSIVFSEETINGDEGEEFSFTYEASNLTESIVWTPANNETNVIDYTINENTNTVSGTLSNPGIVILTATAGTASDSITFNVAEHFTNRLYTVTDKDTVAGSGDAITDAVATYSQTYGTAMQATAGNTMTLSITGLTKRVNINKLVLSMKSNGKQGAGSISIKIDNRDPSFIAGVSSTSGSGFNTFGDNTSYGDSYRDVTWDNLNYSAISSIEIKIYCITTNSLYCKSYDIFFEEEEIVDTVTALSVSPNAWVGYDSQTINVADYTISVTKNGADGTSSDYEFQGIGNGEGDNFQPRVANFTSGHPALTDTRLQWKANYPTEAGGSTYLYAYVSLSVSEDTAVSVALSGNMSKTTYLSTENWDKTGLVVTATYASSAEATVTASSSFKFYNDSAMTNELDSPADLGFGENKTVYIKAIYSGLSNVDAYEQTINVNKAISVTFVAGTDVGSLTEVSKNGIMISAAASESDFSRNDNYRIYSGKNVTISSNKENIVKIEFISNSEANNKLTGEGLTKDGAVSIWTGDSDDVTLTADGGQARYIKIIVTLDSAKYLVESTLKTKTSLSYATYTHHDNGTYSYTDVAIRFGGKIAPALWNRLNTESTIEGYGVLLATSDLGSDSIENWYNAYKTDSNTVEEALAELVTDGVVANYSKSVAEKAHPTQVGDLYSWNLYYRIGNTKAELLEEYTAVAYIKIHNSIVFLQQDTVSAKSLASDMLQGENPETYGGSLSYLAELQEGE